MINEYFGVGVTSEPRMVSAGVEPWMGSSTDKHQLRSTGCYVLTEKSKYKSIKHDLCVLQRASVVFPLTRLPGVMQALRHPWLACHNTRTQLLIISMVCLFSKNSDLSEQRCACALNQSLQKQTSLVSIMLTTPLINEYFGVGVMSEPWMASAGVEP